jgi:hypothetical protein
VRGHALRHALGDHSLEIAERLLHPHVHAL